MQFFSKAGRSLRHILKIDANATTENRKLRTGNGRIDAKIQFAPHLKKCVNFLMQMQQPETEKQRRI
jgi:hypothetical protein